jgi:hypothetical protein
VNQQDIASALQLEAPAARRGLDLAWLERSHAAPGPFFAALHELLARVAAPGPKSDPKQGYDLYHDLVSRHRGRERTALQIHDPRAPADARWIWLSFEQLHARCRKRALAWAERGVTAGAVVCVMLPAGEQAFVSLLAGLWIGACVSLLEPQGPDFIARRLEALGPAFVATDDYYMGWLEGREQLAGTPLLDDANANADREIATHTYAPGEVCAMLFSPLRRAPELPVELTAEQLFRGAVRDGAVALTLRPGDSVAAPGFDLHQHQPALLFAALVMGATWVELDPASVRDAPNLLRDLRLRSVGLTAELREALADQVSDKRPRWDHVFKNPEEPASCEAWREFIELLGLDDVVVSNVLFEAASGGALLGSPRRLGKHSLAHFLDVYPAAGRAHTLLDFSGSGQASVADAGLFAPLVGVEAIGDEGKPDDPQYFALARRRGPEYLYGGPLEPRRAGRVYPVTELIDSLADCPFLQATSVVALPAGGQTLAYRFVLLGFVGHESDEQFNAVAQARRTELERVIQTRLGAAFLPDHIELFRGFARMRDGAVDHNWCWEQYVSGSSFRKHASPSFHRLSALRDALQPRALP